MKKGKLTRKDIEKLKQKTLKKEGKTVCKDKII